MNAPILDYANAIPPKRPVSLLVALLRVCLGTVAVLVCASAGLFLDELCKGESERLAAPGAASAILVLLLSLALRAWLRWGVVELLSILSAFEAITLLVISHFTGLTFGDLFDGHNLAWLRHMTLWVGVPWLVGLLLGSGVLWCRRWGRWNPIDSRLVQENRISRCFRSPPPFPLRPAREKPCAVPPMPAPIPLDYQRRMTPRPMVRRVFLLTLFGFIIVLLALALLLLPPRRASICTHQSACAANLGQIGAAIRLYADDNEGQYPRELGTLVSTLGLSARLLVCPGSDDVALEGAATQPTENLLAGDHCSYVYVGAGLISAAGASDVVAFELPGHHGKTGGNVLYGDGRVRWELFETLVQLVPELEAGRNPPSFKMLTPAQAKALYERKWLPNLARLKGGTWAASLPPRGRGRPGTRASGEE